ncbi:EGF and pentraxin domain-containing protein 1 [Durusdinium trenchii]|uniref:EGF and pentraxin domain-containing protein 1 n=1 Tax=Durusdinium trenchii TaxID=1381693 RepID=A0ABP0QBW3_9DINO
MSTWLFRHWRLLFHFALTLRTLAVDAGDLKDWKDGFSYFTEFVMGGLAISGRSYTLEVLHCNDTLDAAPRIQRCVDMAQTESVDALVVGSSSWNKEIKSAAEPYGGNPAIWTPVSDFGFGTSVGRGFHLPFTWYPEQAIRQAHVGATEESGLSSDSEDAFLGSAARAAAESLFRSSGVVGQLRVVGPSLEWCDRWQNVTSCSVQQGRCCCGDEVETATWLSFYEVAESKVVEPGFDSGAQFVSPALVSFVEGIIEESDGEQEEHVMRNIVELILCHLDLTSPVITSDKPRTKELFIDQVAFLSSIVLNFLRASRSGMAAMINKKFSYKMYYGGPNVPGNASNGYESYWPNGSRAFGFEESVYNVGAGQWHHLLNFSDPIFGSSRAMVSGYRVKYGHVPSYDSAACIAAGVALMTSALENGSWSGLTTMERREWIRSSLGRFQDETVFGRIRFDRNNQNIGRAIVSWQVLEDGEARSEVVVLLEAGLGHALVVGFYLATGLGPWSSARLAGLGDTKMESLMEVGFFKNPMDQAPLQARGFAAGAALYDGGDPSYVVQCGDNSRCPGGLPLGECMPNSFGFACINCAPGYFDDKGFCRSCSETRMCFDSRVALFKEWSGISGMMNCFCKGMYAVCRWIMVDLQA